MSKILKQKIDKQLSGLLCYEIGLNYFNIRKAFIQNEELFHNFYSEACENAKNNLDNNNYFKKIEKIKSYTFIPNTNDEETLKNNLLYIWRGSFSIVNCSYGTFIIIAYAWNYYLVIEAIFCKATEFIKDQLYNYILTNYKDTILQINQFYKL